MVTQSSMTLKVQLVRDGKVIAEVPLEREEWDEEDLESELREFESSLESATEIHDMFSNETRTKMLCEMIRTSDRRFSELMDVLDANQKTVNENLKRMVKHRLVKRVQEKPGEVHYVPTNIGFASTLACMMMRRVLDELEQ